jgi:hypothetical protein
MWLAVALLSQSVALPAFAQLGGAPAGSGQPGLMHQRGTRGGNSNANPSTAAPTPLKPQQEAWPRLEPGAMLCTSEDALMEYQQAVEAASGAPPPMPAGCSRMTQRTGVTIAKRDGPSRTQVKAPSGIGWTDAWLPDKAP